jgi:hypothetical protein
MTSLMIHPDISSEKAIANYSLKLVESIKTYYPEIESLTYTAGKSLTLFKKILNLRKARLLHIQHEYNLLGGFGIPFFFLYPCLKIFNKNRIITTMHTIPSKKAQFKGSKLKTILRKIFYVMQNRVISHFSDKIIVHAEFFKDILVNEYKIESKQIEVVPQAIIENIKTLSRSEARKKLKLEGKVYLIIGSFIPDHGADIIVNQADKIGKTILIAANPLSVNDRNQKRIDSYIAEVKSLIAKNKLERYIRFDLNSDLTSFKLWWQYFSAADLVLLPYRGGIGSGIFSDAIAMNIPMVGSDISYFNEYSKKFGIINIAKNEDYGSAIKDLMKKENYLRMKKQFKKYISIYGTSSIGKIYREIYKK